MNVPFCPFLSLWTCVAEQEIKGCPVTALLGLWETEEGFDFGEWPLESLLVAGSTLGMYLFLEVEKKKRPRWFSWLAPLLVSFNPSSQNRSSCCLLIPRAKIKKAPSDNHCGLLKKKKNPYIDIIAAITLTWWFDTCNFQALESRCPLAPSLVVSQTCSWWRQPVRARGPSHTDPHRDLQI